MASEDHKSKVVTDSLFCRGETISARVDRTMWVSLYEGALTTVYLNWTSGAVLTGYMLYLGATSMQLAMVASIPLLAQISSPFAAWLQMRVPHPKALTVILATLGRALWLLPVLIPLMRLDGVNIPLLILLMVSFSSVFQSSAGTIWTVWMGDIIPEKVRGRYFGIRNGILAIVGLCASLSVGLFLDKFAAPFSYQVVIFTALLFAGGGIYLYSHQHEPRKHHMKLELGQIFGTPLRDRNFRRFIQYVTFWQFSVLIAAVFIYPYFISHLKLGFTQIAIYQAIAAVTTLVFSSRWGALADRFGNKAVLMVSTLFASALLPLCWLLAVPGDPTMIYISGFIDGLGWSAINPAIFNLSLASAPKDTRVAYIGTLTLFTGIAGFLGGLIAAPMLDMFRHAEFVISGITWSAYHWVFLVSAILRTAAILLIRPIKETHSWRARDLIRAALANRLVGFFWR